MEEPTRLLNETGTPLEKALLEEGRAYVPPEALRAHTLAALGISGVAGIATGGALAWFAAKSWITKMLLVFSAATMMVAIPVAYVVFGPAHQSSTASTVYVAAPAAPPIAETPPATEAPTIAPTEALPTGAPSTIPSSPSRAGGNSSVLRAELAALDAVRSTMVANPQGALTFLDAYFRAFPHGRLRIEAEVLRIDSLAKAGRTDEARKSAKDFLQHHPNSLLAARVQAYAGRDRPAPR